MDDNFFHRREVGDEAWFDDDDLMAAHLKKLCFRFILVIFTITTNIIFGFIYADFLNIQKVGVEFLRDSKTNSLVGGAIIALFFCMQYLVFSAMMSKQVVSVQGMIFVHAIASYIDL